MLCTFQHPPGAEARSFIASKITGRAAATTYMATVTPSTTPRIANPPDYTRSAPSTTPGTRPTATLNGA